MLWNANHETVAKTMSNDGRTMPQLCHHGGALRTIDPAWSYFPQYGNFRTWPTTSSTARRWSGRDWPDQPQHFAL